MGREDLSVFDRLGLDPESSLAEIAEQLRELAESPDAAEREQAREAFERLTERPEAHYLELMRSTPHEDPVRVAPLPRAAVALTLAHLLAVRPSDALGPPTEDELALEESP